MLMSDIGQVMHQLCQELFPICRSITGNGFRQSLGILKRELQAIIQHEVPSGTQVFDWEIPKEWNISDAYIITPDGRKICDFQKCNLHVVGYSTPIETSLTLEELDKHLYSLPEQPDAIPYITSYYKERWGFCISDNQRSQLSPGNYQVVIKSQLEPGKLTYGEWILPGETDEEVFLSSYLCHPSMANNELSGPVVATFLGKWLSELPHRRYTYRIVWIPETIGSITYLSRNHQQMIDRVIAGFNLSCMGDDRSFSYLPSRLGGTLADQVALHVLKHKYPEFKRYSFFDRGSDERQYCSPGIDLPVCSIMRTKYACYPEYHTSLDNLDLVTPSGLKGGFNAIQQAIRCLELNEPLQLAVKCEPQLGKRGLYPTISTKESGLQVRQMMNFLAYCDGQHSALEIADLMDVYLLDLEETIARLKEEQLLISPPSKQRADHTNAPKALEKSTPAFS